MTLAYGYNYQFYLDYTTSYRGDVLINTYYSNRLPGTIGGKAFILAKIKSIRKLRYRKKKLYVWTFENVRVIEPVKLPSRFKYKAKKLRDVDIEYEDLNICPEIEDTSLNTVRDWQYQYLFPEIYGATISSRGYYKVHDIRDYMVIN